jgi:hypothetical protein
MLCANQPLCPKIRELGIEDLAGAGEIVEAACGVYILDPASGAIARTKCRA